MNKKRNLAILLSLCCFATLFTVLANRNETNLNSFLTENIEALTSGEHVGGMIECYGEGNVYCPADKKSAYNMVVIYQ